MHTLARLIACLVTCLLTTAAFSSSPASTELRRDVSLDGTWQLAVGSLTTATAAYDRTCPVPGLVDMASPTLGAVGTTRTAHQAYWYRRTFTTSQPLAARATLLVRKAAYGSRIFLNGVALHNENGALENQNSFASSRWDCLPALRRDGGENFLEIRIGEWKTVPREIPNGHDFEKIVYQPGIYDSVTLILSGAPAIGDVQVAPRLESSTADVQFALFGDGAAGDVPVTCTIREAKSGRVAGELITTAHAAATTSGTLSIPISQPHLWSPEDPFLYEVQLATPGDSYRTRFGMRTFSFDPKTGRSMLNGKPYYMRGTNICIFRFFEDPAREQRPWDTEWVRELHRSFKPFHWNAMRYCIGYPPAFWYEIADEEGFLIQDEFPLWNGARGQPMYIQPGTLAQFYREAMRDHWNHPSVVIWDAQNETVTSNTGIAIQQARGADLSNRPWDNGWSAPETPGDSLEVHPYIFNSPVGRMGDMEDITPAFTGTPAVERPANAQIINEYAWLWINRDGTPCRLTTNIYARLLGTTATAEQRRYLYAHNFAAQTEFWRATRRYAAILHFCALSYSRRGGQTSDNFIDVAALKYEPEFKRRASDAFAPVGIAIGRYVTEFAAGQPCEMPVSVINDLDEPAQCTVLLRLTQNNKDLWTSHTSQLTVTPYGKAEHSFTVPLPPQAGKYQFVAELQMVGVTAEQPVTSRRDVTLVPTETAGIAVGSRVIASSFQVKNRRGAHTFSPSKVADGNLTTRWSSNVADGEWITLDLAAPRAFSRLRIHWENAFATAYRIQVSDDNTTWRDIYTTTTSAGGTEELKLPLTTARYIRLQCDKRTTTHGVSIYEIAVFP